MARMTMRKAFLAAAIAGCAVTVTARVTQEQFDLPVEVVDAYGKKIAQPIRVTVFSDDRNPRPAPILVFNHGRAPDAQGRAALGRAQFSVASGFFVRHGFIVAVPTRIGYGVSGGEDVENSGPCENKRFAPGFAAAMTQTAAVLQAVRQRPDAAQDRAVLAGQSYGGGTTVAASAANLPGVVAGINFAGGSGGDPKNSPGRSCAPQRLQRLMAEYGATSRIPTLWMYAENDQYFGPDRPREWFDAFREAGGQGEFIEFPPQGEDGHQTFARFPQTWQPPVDAFLARLGFPALRPASSPAPKQSATPQP